MWKLHEMIICIVLYGATLCLIFTSDADGQSHKKKLRIVISHFHEPIERLAWLHNYTYTIYSRSDCGESHGLHLTPLMENVGREGFIYLQHIALNYRNLDEITVFLQADVAIDNAAILQGAINELIAGHEAFQIYGFLYVLPACFTSSTRIAPFTPKLIQEFNLKNFSDIPTPFLTDDYEVEFSNLVSILFGVNLNHKPMFSPSGSFAVSRAQIHRHPVCYYVDLARHLGKENRPPIGFFFERTWSYVFGSDCAQVRGCNFFDLCR